MKVTVFGSSSPNTPKKYLDSAFNLGVQLAVNGFVCVNGGGGLGVMGSLNEGCRSAGGHIRGVIHEMFCVDIHHDSKIEDLIVCRGNDLKERKQLLLDNGDCLLVMPGGVGTFDELWDAVCTKSLGLGGLSSKPICVVDVDGFFDGSIAQLHRAADEGLLHHPRDTYFHVAASTAEALAWCVQHVKGAQQAVVSSNGDLTNTPVSVVDLADDIESKSKRSAVWKKAALDETHPILMLNDNRAHTSKMASMMIGMVLGATVTFLFVAMRKS
jgi:uncharacterized protein (TIGR00730 family)